MMRVLLDENGHVNTTYIDSYIELHGIDKPFFGSDEVYDQQTLLFAAVSSKEISQNKKIELVSHLLQKGADINGWFNNEKGGLIAVALSQNNTDLADLLLNSGASVYHSYQEKNLLDIVLETKNESIILWFLKYAKGFFSDLDLKTVANIFSAIKNNHSGNLKINEALIAIEKEYVAAKNQEILSKFSRLGQIGKEITALIIAAEMQKKSHSNTIFVIGDEDIPTLTQEIKKLLEEKTVEDKTKFQIIYFPVTHAIFGEFVIQKNFSESKVTYIHCDPLPATIAYNEIITNVFVEEISPLAMVEVLESDVCIQKGLGCSYFSIDGALMLATPEDKSYVPDFALHMKKHSKESFRPFKDKDVTYLQSSSLPVRFIRGLQYFEDEVVGYQYVKGLNSSIFHSKDGQTIVNKKNKTAEESVTEDITERPSKKSEDEMVKINLRAERKMNNYYKSVKAFLEKFSLADPKTIDLIEDCKITGFVSFCNSKKTEKVTFKNS